MRTRNLLVPAGSRQLTKASVMFACALLGLAGWLMAPYATWLRQVDPHAGYALSRRVAPVPTVSGAPNSAARTDFVTERRAPTGLGELAKPIHDPSASDSDETALFFPQTGHSLLRFKRFWEQSNGLVTFGFPLTGEIEEVDPDTGARRITQYFTNQVFHAYPELAGTPYETQLRRIGVEDAGRRGLLSSKPFEPLPAAEAGRVDCQYFPETGHQMCGAFLLFWRSYGLDFGDPEISFRESLALFGYPISEQYVDERTGAVTQYFERARMEYQPTPSGSASVALGWLGADLLNKRPAP